MRERRRFLWKQKIIATKAGFSNQMTAMDFISMKEGSRRKIWISEPVHSMPRAQNRNRMFNENGPILVPHFISSNFQIITPHNSKKKLNTRNREKVGEGRY